MSNTQTTIMLSFSNSNDQKDEMIDWAKDVISSIIRTNCNLIFGGEIMGNGLFDHIVKMADLFYMAGGKTQGFLGAKPGLQEEFELALEKTKKSKAFILINRYFDGYIKNLKINPAEIAIIGPLRFMNRDYEVLTALVK